MREAPRRGAGFAAWTIPCASPTRAGDGMTLNTMLIMMLYSVGMACGQVLFKKAAISSVEAGAGAGLLAYLNVYLILALTLYVGLAGLWVWILRSVSLSAAYPFVALAFVFTPLMASVFFGERLSSGYFVGMALIAFGIVVIARQ